MKLSLSAILFVAVVAGLPISTFAQSESRDEVWKQIGSKRTELSALEEKFLAPSAEDRVAFAEFLKQPNTGIIRLLPREVYDNSKSLTVRGGGAYYSFVRLTHEYGYGSDIELSSGFLSVGFAGADYGMLTKLGEVPLEQITMEHPGVLFMAAYEAPREEPRARLEYRRFATGATIDDGLYQSRVPADVGTTYLLRSIDYGNSDVLITFRVVKKDSDGSVIIVWKLLKTYPKPELARNRTEQ